MKHTLIIITLAILAALPALANETCGRETACPIGERSYYARLPDNFDSTKPMPVLLHFHGWGRQGKLIVNHRRIAGATRPRGVLLLAPNGLGMTWDFWDNDTGDAQFALDVINDAAKKWNIDRTKIFVSGYSYGSIMAWRFACLHGDQIHSLLAISGSINDQSETCRHPVNVRHVHGKKDNVLFFQFSDNGGVDGQVKLWIETNKCRKKHNKITKWQTTKLLPINRHIWNCRSGKTIRLDVHERGHFIPRNWFNAQLDELLGE